MRTLILVVAAFGAGVALGYALDSGEDQATRAERPEARSPGPSTLHDTEQTPVPLPEALEPALDALIRSVPVPEHRTGNGHVTGYVLTDAGDAVPGATITLRPAWRSADPILRQWSGDAPLVTQVHRFVAYRKWSQAVQRIGTTDSAGFYEVTELAPGKYYSDARCGGYSIRLKNRRHHSNVKAGATVDFVAKAVVEVDVDVLMPDGSRATQARLTLKGRSRRSGGSSYSWSTGHERLQFPEGDFLLHAIAGEDRELKSEPVEVSFRRADPQARLVLELKGRPGLRGKVLVPEELKLRDVYVYAKVFGGTEIPTEPINLRRLRGVRVNEDEDYAYFVKDLQPGRYLVGVSVNRTTLETMELVEVPAYTLDRDLAFPLPDPKRHRVVRVLGPDGKPLTRAQFMDHYEAKLFKGAGPCTVFAQEDGSYLIRTMDWGARSAPEGGKHTLTIRTQEHGSITREWDPHAAAPLVVQVAETATLEVTLEGYAGSGHEGSVRLTVRAASEAYRRPSAGPDGIDARGRQTIRPLQPGDAVLLVGVDIKGSFWFADRIPVSLKPGANKISVPMPRLYGLEVSGTPRQRFLISAVGPGKGHMLRYWTLEKDGKLTIERLPAGTYDVAVYEDGKNWKQTITLPGQATLRIP